MLAIEETCTDQKSIGVAYVFGGIHTQHAGTEGQILRLARNLDPLRWRPNLIVMQATDWTEQFSDPRVPLHVMGFRSFFRPQDWLVISHLAKQFQRLQVDLVELHSVDAQFAGALAARLAKVPVIISCRRNQGDRYKLKERMLLNLANRFATRFLANSQRLADRMSQLEGIARDRFDVIPNGVDLAEFDRLAQLPVDAEFEQRIRGKRVISIAANLRPVKNHRNFLSAAAQLAARHPDVVFAILGAGNLMPDLQQEADRLGIADKTIWLGSVPEVAPYLVRSHIGCLTSDAEGFSNAIIEYMSAGLPVVATAVGGAGEAVVDGQTGYLVPPANSDQLAEKLETLLRLPETEHTRMGQLGRQRVEDHFTFPSQLDAYEALYRARTSANNPILELKET